ncbi:hypothetical protein F2Q68_00030185 [Brassica cretica]|uniref:Uncharacterized protein n=1 Tax=Brassica cretica TaxID=69181 RepID=A0A8S9GE31_BRACR|nr:hypothetical protein F2Q68_00030185 [Brassica cretica]
MTFLQHDVFCETSYQRNIILKTLEAGWELSRTRIKHDEIEARRENPKLDETLISNIRIGVEKYSGLIADQKIAGRTEIKRMNREARGGSLHGFRTWCQPSNKLSFYRCSRCCRAWKLYMQPDILTSGRSGGVLHASWTCSQPCGARGAAAHASGAMRSDTRAATNLKLIVQFYGFRSVKVLLDTPPGSPKNCPEARGGSVRVQISLSRPISFFMVKPRFCPSRDQTVQSIQVVPWVLAKSSPINQLLLA